MEAMLFVLLAFGGRRNRTLVVDTRKCMACSVASVVLVLLCE